MNFPYFLIACFVAVLSAGLGWWQGAPDAKTEGTPPPATAGSSATTRATAAAPASGAWQDWADTFARAATSAELAALAEEILAWDYSPEKPIVLRLLCARWAEVDPPGGLAFFAERGDDGENGRRWLLAEWALLDMEAVWAVVSSETDEQKRSADVSTVGEALLLENLDVFWTWFQKARGPLPHLSSRSKPSAAWLELARRHARELEALAAELAAAPKDETARFATPRYAGLYLVLARVRAQDDPASALAWVNTVPEGVRNGCLQVVLPLLAKTDLDATRKALDEMKNRQTGPNSFVGSGRDQVVAGIAEEMGKTDPRAAVEWVAKIPGEHRSYPDTEPIVNIMNTAMKEGRLSPREAFEFIREQKSEGEIIRLNVLRKMWEGLPAAQLAETAAWLKDVDSANAKGWALAGLVTTWANTDPQAAMAFASGIEDAGARQDIFRESLLSHFGKANVPGELEKLLATIPPADRAAVIQDNVRMSYGDGMLDVDSGSGSSFQATAFAGALAGTPPGEARDAATRRVFQTWGALDPDAALTWVVQQPDADLRRTSLMSTMEGWAKYDAWAASQWLADQPRGPDRDTATHQLARSLRDVEPDSAWTWAADIGDPAIRLEARAAVLRQWRAADAAAAQAAVAALTHLTPPERQKLTDTLAGRDD